MIKVTPKKHPRFSTDRFAEREQPMMVETMNEGKDKYILSSQLDKNLEQQKIICNFKNFNNSMRKQLINLQRDYSKLLNTYLKVAQ